MTTTTPPVQVFDDIEQGTEAWHAARRGIITASVVGQLITSGSPDALSVDCPSCEQPAASSCISTARKVPTPIKTIHDARTLIATSLPPVYRVATTDYSRALTASLVAERITGYTEPVQTSRDMERGTLDEPYARDIYSEHYAPATETGFMTRDFGDFKIGFSPDGLVGDGGLIEIKSRRQKKHLATILADKAPLENMAQMQCGLLVSGRDWCDYVSYCGGMPLFVKRVLPDPLWFVAIVEAVATFEMSANYMTMKYREAVEGLPPTERIDHFAELEITF